MSEIIVVQEQKHAGERKERGFDLTDFCSKFWGPGQFVPEGFRLRPLPKSLDGRGSDGYEYEAGGDGQTGEREPTWADGVLDGSVPWIRRAISGQSLFRTIAGAGSVQWLADPGMTVNGALVAVGSAVQISAFHSGGTEGESYRVIARVTFTDGSIEDFAIDWVIVDDEIA